MHLLLLGHHVTVDTSLLPDAVTGRLEHIWAQCVVAEPPHEPELTVRVLPPDYDGTADVDDVLLSDLSSDETYTVSQHLTSLAIGLASGSLLLFHAAALAPAPAGGHDDARPAPVVGLIASSGTGKTTFCRRLTDGFHYLTDETLAVDPATLEVRPYPKPLSVIPVADDDSASGQPLARRKADHQPADLGLSPLSPATAPAPRLAALVVARRVEDGNELEPLGVVEAIVEAVAQTSSLFRLEHPLRVLARALTLAGGPWRLTFSDQAQCADLLTSLAADPDVEPPAWHHLPGTASTAAERAVDGLDAGGVPVSRLVPVDDPEIDARTLLARAPWDDAVASEGAVALLYGRSPIALGGPGAAVWTACEAPSTLEDLHAHVVAELGEHPGSREVVTQAVHELVRRGVLVLA